MRNFSGNEPKNLVSDAPAFIQFFFDPSRPKALRIGAGVLAAVIFLVPLFSANSSRPRPEAAAPVVEKEAPVEQAAVVEPVPAAKDELFTALPGLFPVPIGIAQAKSGSIWTSTVQDIFEFRDGVGTKKLDGPAYEGVFNEDFPPLTASYLDDGGELWAGSLDGQVMRYTSYDWKIVWESKEPIRDRISAMIRLDNTLFIGTNKGLWKWEMASGKLSRFKGFAENPINAFLKTKSGELYLAARDGVWQLSEAGWRQTLAVHTERGALSLADAGNGGLWIGTDEGLIRYASDGSPNLKMLAASTIISLAAAADGALWAGTQSEGLFYFDGKGWYHASESEKLPGANVSEILLDSTDGIWLGIAGKGIQRAARDAVLEWIRKYPHEDIPFDDDAPRVYKNACHAVATELKKTTESGEVSYMRGKTTTMVFFRGKLVCPSIPGYRTADNDAIVMKKNLLIRLSKEDGAPIELPATIPYFEVKQLFVDSKGRIWLGRDAGPAMYNSEAGWVDYSKDDPAFLNNSAQAFAEDKNGGVWVGTAPTFDQASQSYLQAPLHRFDGKEWMHYSADAGLPGYTVSTLLPQKDGGLVVGTPGGFAFVTEAGIAPGGTGKNFRAGAVMSLNEDETGRLWYGHLYFKKGVSWFDRSKPAVVSKIETPGKLFAENIAAVVHDGKEHIWLMATSGQIGVYTVKALEGLKDE